MSKFLINKLNVRQYIHCASLHHETKYAEPAADIIAKEWNHSAGEKERNIESMIMKSKDTLPCHLALVIKSVVEVDNNCTESDHPEKTIVLEPSDEHDLVVAHVKLLKVDGRSDGPCCSCYSLVVMDRYRGLGLGRLLTEEAENYAQSRGFGHIYLSTNDKVRSRIILLLLQLVHQLLVYQFTSLFVFTRVLFYKNTIFGIGFDYKNRE